MGSSVASSDLRDLMRRGELMGKKTKQLVELLIPIDKVLV